MTQNITTFLPFQTKTFLANINTMYINRSMETDAKNAKSDGKFTDGIIKSDLYVGNFTADRITSVYTVGKVTAAIFTSVSTFGNFTAARFTSDLYVGNFTATHFTSDLYVGNFAGGIDNFNTLN